jgi:membrane-bound serine protease (ClpP class)
MVLGLFAVGTLPVNWAGVALIILAFALFAGEAFAPGVGAFGVGGAIALIAGGLILTTSNDPDFQVSRWLVFGTGAVVAAFFLMIAGAIWNMRRTPPSMGPQAMIGQTVMTRSYLDPEGFVFVKGERWRAVAEDAPIAEGEPVMITAVKGLRLSVRRRPPEPV